MQTCKNCQSTLPDDAPLCPICGSPVPKDNDDARRHLLLRLRAGTLTTPLAATAAAIPYIIATTLILGFVIVGVFLRPPVIHSTQPLLIVAPHTLDFGKKIMGDKQVQYLTIKNSSGSTLHWTTDTTKASWLKLDTSSGDLGPNAHQIVKATMDTNGLSPQPIPYSANISFNASGMSIPVKTTVTVIASGKLCVNPDPLDFGTLGQGSPGLRFVTVGNCGTQQLNWFIDPGKENWVTLSSTKGIIKPGEEQQVQVTVDTSQLTLATHVTNLTFASNKGSQVVTIKVTVTSQSSTINHVPNWSADLTNLDPDNSRCSRNNGTWNCTVILTENATSQENINWSLNSNLGATFNPPGGSLNPGEQKKVTLSSITCLNNTFTFYGAEGETPIMISWTCTPPCIKADQSLLTSTVMQGQPSVAHNVTFTNCGTDMGNVSVLPTTTDGASWLIVRPVTTESLNSPLAPKMTETISVSYSSSNLQPGTYQGIITASLTTNTGTISATVNVMLTVSPCFKVDQPSISFTSPGRVFSQPVTFTNCGEYPGNVNVSPSTSDGANWLFINIKGSDQTSGPLDLGPLGAGQTDTIFVSFYARGLTPAMFQGSISATLTTNSIATSAPVNVILTVLSPPHMTVSASNLDFGSMQQGHSTSQQLTIGNTGEQALSWNVQTGGVPWVILDTSNGTIQGKSGQPIQVTVDTAHLKAGDFTYTATLTFNSNADNSPVLVKITLVVTPPPKMQLSTLMLSFGTCSNNTPSQDITITNAGGGMLNWMAGTPSVTWLTVGLTSGSNSVAPGLSSTLTFTIDKLHTGNATVVITAEDGESANVMVSVAACNIIN